MNGDERLNAELAELAELRRPRSVDSDHHKALAAAAAANDGQVRELVHAFAKRVNEPPLPIVDLSASWVPFREGVLRRRNSKLVVEERRVASGWSVALSHRAVQLSPERGYSSSTWASKHLVVTTSEELMFLRGETTTEFGAAPPPKRFVRNDSALPGGGFGPLRGAFPSAIYLGLGLHESDLPGAHQEWFDPGNDIGVRSRRWVSSDRDGAVIEWFTRRLAGRLLK